MKDTTWRCVFAWILTCSLGLPCVGYTELIDKGNGLILDTDLQVMWIKDLNPAATTGFDSDGKMPFQSALAFIDAMNAGEIPNFGYTDWRLPTTLIPDPTCDTNPNLGVGFHCTGSEMGHLYYTELGLLAHQFGTATSHLPFFNLQGTYWSGTEQRPGWSAMVFALLGGNQFVADEFAVEGAVAPVRDVGEFEEETCYITNIDFFTEQCPTRDAAIDEILSDFRITLDGVDIGEVACDEPISSMPIEAFTNELRVLQILRTAYYLDKNQFGHLPWANVNLYSWLKSKIGGFNISSTARYNSCCGVWSNGDLFITLTSQTPDDVKFLLGWPFLGSGVALVMHEARHADGFGHPSCCSAGSGACDLRYDESDLSPYGIQYWLFRAFFDGTLYTGFTCGSAERRDYIASHLVSGANGYIPRFCESPPPEVESAITAPCRNCQPPWSIYAINDGPYTVDEGEAILGVFNVLDNDLAPANATLTAVIESPPAHASSFALRPDGSFDYAHDGSETTLDTFTYRATDLIDVSDIATVTLEILPVNDRPVISLLGEATITLIQGGTFEDPGAVALDEEDGDISANIIIGGDAVNTAAAGTYTITYNVMDTLGNAATEVTRTVTVNSLPEPPPRKKKSGGAAGLVEIAGLMILTVLVFFRRRRVRKPIA